MPAKPIFRLLIAFTDLACLALLASCAMLQITPAPPGPGTPTLGPTSTPDATETPTPDRAATQDAARFRETVQTFQTESAAENATERAATARPTTTATIAPDETPTAIPRPELEELDTSNISELQQLDILQTDPIQEVVYHHQAGFLEVHTSSEIALFDLELIAAIRRFQSSEVSALGASQDGEYLLIGGEDGRVVVERLANGERLELADEFLGISSLTISADNGMVAGLTKEGDLKLWDRAGGEELVSFFTRFYFDYASFGDWLAFSPEGDRLAAFAEQSASMLVWSLDDLLGEDAEPAFNAWRESFFEAKHANLAPDWGSVLWWQTDRARIFELDGQPRADALTFPAQITRAAFTNDGEYFLIAYDESREGLTFGTIQVYLSESSELQFTFSQPSPITTWLLSPRGRQVVIGYEDGSLILWDAGTGQPIYELVGHSAAVTGLVFSPDGRILGSAAQDGTIRFWGVSSGAALAEIPSANEKQMWMAFSPDNRVLAIASDFGQVRFLGVRP